MGMSEELLEEQPALTKKEKTKADKQAEHIARIKRTLVASLLGILTGILSYWSGGTPNISRTAGKRISGVHADACRGSRPETHLQTPWHGHLKTGCKRLVLPGIHDLCILVHDMDDPVDLILPGTDIIKSFLGFS